ncbi:unnamed protein product [Rotaria sordida]|uniref:Uncharacterized protein n=1 Tax=Rotaria sordida TaxID=392033 RepID=A0A815IJW9_9BILA|nr:unnamed protein product [Rotaria sordida]CAF1390553.1 unnamed protein product [Rotaria sordida]CAF1610871.1 unnamed protein product [Rotaria sordida]
MNAKQKQKNVSTMFEIARGTNQSIGVTYQHQGITIETEMVIRKNVISLNVKNDEIQLDESSVPFNLDVYVKKSKTGFEITNTIELDELLKDLIKRITIKLNQDIYCDERMSSNFHGQYGPNTDDPYGQLPSHHPQPQIVRNQNEIQMEYRNGKAEHMYGQPPSSLTSTIVLTSEGGDLGSYDNLFSSRNNKNEVQLTASSSQMYYNEFDDIDMDDEQLTTTRHLNRTYQSGNEIANNLRSSSSHKDESLTTSQHSISTSNQNTNTLLFEQQWQPFSSTTPTHHFQTIRPQSISAASSHSSKFIINNNSTKDKSLYMNSDSKPSISSMTSSQNNMFQIRNTSPSLISSYNLSTNQGSKQSLNNSNLPSQYMGFQNMNPHDRMLASPDVTPKQFNPYESIVPNNPAQLSKALPHSPPSSDSMQQYSHHLSSSNYFQTYNMNPLYNAPSGHQQQQQRMHFSPMIPGSVFTRTRRHHLYHDPSMYPPHPITIMPIQQLNIQHLGLDAPSNFQQQQNQSNDPQLDPIINYVKAPPQNSNLYDEPSPPH